MSERSKWCLSKLNEIKRQVRVEMPQLKENDVRALAGYVFKSEFGNDPDYEKLKKPTKK